MILFTLLTLAGLVYARGTCPVANATQTWFSIDAENSNFSMPAILDTDLTSFVTINAPSIWNATTKACECPKQLTKFTYWSTNGTYDDKKCIYDCDRCQLIFCVDDYGIGNIVDTFNVVVDNDGLNPTCKKGLVFNTTTTTTASTNTSTTTTATATATKTTTNTSTVTATETETATDTETETDTETGDESETDNDDDLNIDIGVHVSDGDYNYNYTYTYPNVTQSPSTSKPTPTSTPTSTENATTVVAEP